MALKMCWFKQATKNRHLDGSAFCWEHAWQQKSANRFYFLSEQSGFITQYRNLTNKKLRACAQVHKNPPHGDPSLRPSL